jgi:selenocysteine-specific elongation factor
MDQGRFKSNCFDAVVEFVSSWKQGFLSGLICFDEERSPARFEIYEDAKEKYADFAFVQVHLSSPLSLKWKDVFEFRSPDGKILWGKGKVLDPFSQKTTRSKKKRRLAFLKQLLGSEKNMLFVLAQFKGAKGLKEDEILRFCRLSESQMLRLAQELEAEAKAKILTFSPLFFLSQASFDFLCEKITAYLAVYHEKHPDERGVSRDKIQKRFGLPPRIFSLVMRYLEQEGRLREIDGQLALFDFNIFLSPQEEKILARLEDLCLKGEFQSVSMEVLQKTFRLSAKRLHTLLSILVERKKIIQGKDGFLLHSHWLEGIIEKIRNSGKKELTVSDFKEMTGLSRKYAIPLLELLDQMGITKRRGPVREIQ